MFQDTIAISKDIKEAIENCWLAATNPHFFRELRNRQAIEGVNLLQIWERLSTVDFLGKKVRTNDIPSGDILSQFHEILELNDEEKKILSSQKCLQSANQICLIESSAFPEILAEHSNNEDTADFGVITLDQINCFSRPMTPRKRTYFEANEDDTLKFKYISKTPHLSNSADFEINNETESSETGVSSNFDPNKSKDELISEDIFRQNISTTSTPIRPRSKPTRISLDTLEAPIIPEISEKKQNKRKNKIGFKVDKVITIDKRQLTKQLNYVRTLRNTDAKNDIVPTIEAKKISSEVLIRTPCHRTFSRLLIQRFARNTITRTLNTHTNMRQQLSFSVEIDRIIKVTSQSSTKRFRDKVGAIEDQFSSEPLQEKKSTTTKISILTKAAEEMPSKCLKRNESSLQNHQENIFNILQRHWGERRYPINMRTIYQHKMNRRIAALTFLTILELNAKGQIEVIKNPVTQEIDHIQKKPHCRKLA
ncbi:unnamed protein product [Hermetia illucens]|uniref:Uncharacterized protein n=1 Tax=Hermetia illucens TaxID=343691 RepID=A0A7R8UDV7_HERIL|nr:unnamed protein product [Hermetia illucens]